MSSAASFGDLISSQQQRRRDRETERSGGFQIDDPESDQLGGEGWKLFDACRESILERDVPSFDIAEVMQALEKRVTPGCVDRLRQGRQVSDAWNLPHRLRLSGKRYDEHSKTEEDCARRACDQQSPPCATARAPRA